MGTGSFILFGAVMGVDTWAFGLLIYLIYCHFYVLHICFQCTPLERKERMTQCYATAWARVTRCAHYEEL